DAEPRFIAYVSPYDHIVLAQLFGNMQALPKSFPHYSWDLKQKWEELGKPKLPDQESKGDHNSLEDAKWTKKACDFLEKKFGIVIPKNKKKVKNEVGGMIAIKYLL